jgi:BolA protein
MINQKERIEKKLRTSLTIEYLDLRDDSGSHADHYEGSEDIISHLTIIIWAKEFVGASILEKHRLVNNIVADEFSKGLHALQIKLKEPKTIDSSVL